MLKKLYKHEFYALFRNLVPVYAALIGLAVLSRLSNLVDINNTIFDVVKGFSTVLYVLAIIGMFVVGVVIVVMRFYKHLLSQEGYLTFTLPVKPSQHITCKLICGTAVMIVNIIAAVASLLILGIGTNTLSDIFQVLKGSWNEATALVPAWQLYLFIAEIVALCIVAIAEMQLMLYTSMSIGQLFKNKVAGAVVTFICIYAAVEIINLVVTLPVILINSAKFEKYLQSGVSALLVFFAVLLVWEILYGVVYYFVTRYMLSKKLNLE